MADTVHVVSWSGVTREEWDALASRRIFFGHQSVGRNVVDGIATLLAERAGVGFPVYESTDWNSQLQPPGLYHAAVGRNTFPSEKVSEFVRIASRGGNSPGNVGMLKFCYVDINKGLDARHVFEDYHRGINALRAQSSALTIVHITMPLCTAETGLGYWRGKLRGRPTERDRNVVRNEYNRLLRAEYGSTGAIFDLAALESRRPNGTLSHFRRGGRIVYDLAPELTDDGGHLNQRGRRMVAEQLLIFLAKLPMPATPPRQGRL